MGIKHPMLHFKEALHAMIHYRGYNIEYDPPPIPIRSCDWQWSADGYDGAEDSRDIRCGSSPSLESAKRDIDEQIEELFDGDDQQSGNTETDKRLPEDGRKEIPGVPA